MFEDAYEGRLRRDPDWVDDFREDEFLGLEKAYEAQAEAEKWVDEFQEDQKMKNDEDEWFDQYLQKVVLFETKIHYNQ